MPNVTPGNWTLDPLHTEVSLTVRHAGITKVSALFENAEADLVVNDDNTGSVEASIDTDSFNSQSVDRDNHIKSSDFLDVDKYPEITFKVSHTKVEHDFFEITGDLTIRGITKPVVVDAEFGGEAVDPFGAKRIGFSASTAISRREFGLVWNAVLETGGVLVGDKVSIEIDAAFVLKDEA